MMLIQYFLKSVFNEFLKEIVNFPLKGFLKLKFIGNLLTWLSLATGLPSLSIRSVFLPFLSSSPFAFNLWLVRVNVIGT